MNMNAPAYFEIQADNTERAMKFYTEIFGWKIWKDDSMPLEYWRIETHGPNGGIMKRPQSLSGGQGANSFISSIVVEDFDVVAQKINSMGGKVALPKFAVPGTCWQGYFIDTEGNTFGLFQVDTNAK